VAAIQPALRAYPTELLWNLTLRELRGKYKRSTLGHLWSIVNPLATIAIYTVVFGTFMKFSPEPGRPSGNTMFVFYLCTGLLPWTFLSNALMGGASSITGNESLVKKVFFPRSVLPAASTLALLASFAIEMAVLGVVFLLFGYMVLPWVPLVVVVMLLQTVFVLGLALMVSAANAYFRDVQHFLAIGLNVWFYMTPIIYPARVVVETSSIATTVFLRLNPMTRFVDVYRALLWDMRFPTPMQWLTVCIISFGTLLVGALAFQRLEPRLAEEL
jgi:lipopolysaccharide transport system permease protein